MSSIADIKFKDRLRFNTHNPQDRTDWDVRVEAIGGYNIARSYDIMPYYRSVATQIPDIASPEELTWLEVVETQTGTRKAIAAEWIDLDSLKINEPDKKATIRLHDVTDEQVKQAIDILRASGYRCGIAK